MSTVLYQSEIYIYKDLVLHIDLFPNLDICIISYLAKLIDISSASSIETYVEKDRNFKLFVKLHRLYLARKVSLLFIHLFIKMVNRQRT